MSYIFDYPKIKPQQNKRVKISGKFPTITVQISYR